ncbi:MAG: response regulator transcription factor [Saprospiraceae bacterium]|nr:response regulator transcription factor [Saprospiraceae bacterium]
MNTEILIIEDEIPAQEHLIRQLSLIEPNITILDRLDSIESSVLWLTKYKADLIFMDIQLSDGLSFTIFDQVQIKTPIIFTTAYDAYAIKAFKVNSIDYLLKPIDEDDLRNSLLKYNDISQQTNSIDIEMLKDALLPHQRTFQERFMVTRGEKLLSVRTDQIAYFEGEDRYVYLVKKDGSRFIINYRLSDLVNLLNPAHFFRINRSFIAHFDAIQSMVNVSKSRVKVGLLPTPKRDVIVSSENNQEFKNWLNL